MTKEEKKAYHKEYHKKWYAEHREEVLAQHRQNKDKLKVYANRYYYNQKQRFAELKAQNEQMKRDFEELTITNDYQKVISDKNERISFLEAQIEKLIEKMKCCEMCKYFDIDAPKYCDKGIYRAHLCVCNDWEIKEND